MEMDDLVKNYNRSNNGDRRHPFVLLEFCSAAIYYIATGGTRMTMKEWHGWLDENPTRWIE